MNMRQMVAKDQRPKAKNQRVPIPNTEVKPAGADGTGIVSTLNLSLKLYDYATQVKGIVAEVQQRIGRLSEGSADEE